eukprot:1157104-Ditylum_brightwellii.AAC.1
MGENGEEEEESPLILHNHNYIVATSKPISILSPNSLAATGGRSIDSTFYYDVYQRWHHAFNIIKMLLHTL